MQSFILLVGLFASAFGAPVKEAPVPEKPNVNSHPHAAAPVAEKPALKAAAVKSAPVPEKPAVKAAVVQSKHVVPVPAKPTVKLPVPNLHGKATAPVLEKPAVKAVATTAAAHVAEKPAVKAVAVKAVAVKAAAMKAAAPVPEKQAVKAAAVQSKHVVPVPEKPTAKLPVPNLHMKAAVAVQEKPAVKQPVKSSHTVPAPAKAVPVPEKPSAKLPVPNLHGHADAEAAGARGLAEPVSCKRLEACLAQGAGLAEDKEKTKLKTCIQSFCEDMVSQGKNVSNSRVCDAKGKEIMDIIAMAIKEKKVSLVALKSESPVTYAAVFHALLAQGSDVKQVTDACRLQSSTFLKAASVQKHADAPKLPEQGYEGKGVKHENMKSITSDFGAEYGPTTQKPVAHSGAQGSAIAIAVVVSAVAVLL